jgi:hypothetical protein
VFWDIEVGRVIFDGGRGTSRLWLEEGWVDEGWFGNG